MKLGQALSRAKKKIEERERKRRRGNAKLILYMEIFTVCSHIST
jgi:hypothetical protein